MTISRSLVLLLTCFFIAACGVEPDPSNQLTQPDAGGFDADYDADRDAYHNDAGMSDAPDVGDDTGEPLPHWDCDPHFPVGTVRYRDIEDLSDVDLFIALYNQVGGHTNRGYNNARDYMFNHLDVRDDGMLECVYTARRVEPDGSRTPDGFNTEHIWPQSRGAGEEPMRSDLHHLTPIDADANNARAAYEFGNVDCDENTCPWHEGGSFLGPSADDDRELVFQVRPDRRGDMARAILYFSLRYGQNVSAEEEAVLRQWNCEDPPDDFERARNDALNVFQNNRNPFIDRPDFVDQISEF